MFLLDLLRWTAEQLKKLIAMLCNPEFDSKEVDPDLHKRMEKAVEDGRIRCFNMREESAREDRGKGWLEFRESTQYSTQGSRDCPVGKYGQHLVSSSRGMSSYILVRTCMY